jgi:hypothetical protein
LAWVTRRTEEESFFILTAQNGCCRYWYMYNEGNQSASRVFANDTMIIVIPAISTIVVFVAVASPRQFSHLRPSPGIFTTTLMNELQEFQQSSTNPSTSSSSSLASSSSSLRLTLDYSHWVRKRRKKKETKCSPMNVVGWWISSPLILSLFRVFLSLPDFLSDGGGRKSVRRWK